MKTKHLLLVAIVALAMLSSCKGSDEKTVELSYAPWSDLSVHFDLTKVRPLNGSNMLTFNSYDLTHGRLPMTSDRLSQGEYNAVILGTGVWMRSQPVVTGATKLLQLNTGRRFVVTQHNFFANGRYWHYGFVVSPSTGMYQYGFVCSDYVVGLEQYEVVKKYVFSQTSNLNYLTSSKILHAVADVLLKFNVDRSMPNLSVVMLNEYPFGHHTIVAYQIRDYSMPYNNCMLAIVQFNNNTNDFIVLGVVPGNAVNQVQPNANGSYDIYFY